MLNLFLNKYLCSIQSSWNWNGHVTVVLPDFREWQRLWLTVIWSVRHQARALERHIEHLVNPTHRADKRKHFLPITGKINMQFWLFFLRNSGACPGRDKSIAVWLLRCCSEWLLGGYFLAQWCSGLWMWPSSSVSEIKGIFRPCSNLAGEKNSNCLEK